MLSLAESLNGLGHELVRLLGPLSLEMVILTIVILAAIRLMRIRSPALRHLFWLLLLLKPVSSFLIASPMTLYAFARPYLVGSASRPADNSGMTVLPPGLSATTPTVAHLAPATVADEDMYTPAQDPSSALWEQEMLKAYSALETTGGSAARATEVPVAGRLGPVGWLAALWTIGASALGVRLLLGWAWSHVLHRRSAAECDKRVECLLAAARGRLRVSRRVRVRLCAEGTGPAVLGIIRPVILLPRSLVRSLADSELEMVLAHEVAHVRRQDNLFLLFYRCIEAVLFFHPCVWLCGRALRREADAACDDAVMRAFGDPDGYANSLTRIAEEHRVSKQLAFASTLMAVESNFAQRVRRALRGGPARVTVGSAVVSLCVLAAIAAVGLPRTGARASDGTQVPTDPGAQPSLAEDDSTPVDFAAVDPDLDLHGIVVDRPGRPVEGAVLRAVRYPWDRLNVLKLDSRRIDEVVGTARSGADGAFSLRLRRGELVHLRVQAEGYAPLEIPRLQSGERVRVELVPPVALHVTCTDEEGEPAEGALVRLRRIGWRGDHCFDLAAITDRDGLAAFTDLPSGSRGTLEIEHERFGSPGWVRVDFPQEGTKQFKVALPSGRTITGRVIDGVTLEPVPNARVGMGWTLFRATTTDDDGCYSLHGWTGEGYQEIAVDVPAYAQAIRRVGDEKTIDFELETGRLVTGRTIDDSGNPLKGVLVSAQASLPPQPEFLCHRYTTTDANGCFSVAGLHTDTPIALTLRCLHHGKALLEVPSGAAPSDVGDIVMYPGQMIAGVLKDTEGRPMARHEVRLTGPRTGQIPDRNTREERLTDNRGRFYFPDLSPGEYRLMAEFPGSHPVEREIKLPPREDILGLSLAFPQGEPFTVWVHDEDGMPVEGARIDVSDSKPVDREHGPLRASTDSSGMAVFRVHRPVRYVSGPYIAPSVREQVGDERRFLPAAAIRHVKTGQNDVRFVLELAGFARGTVYLPAGQPASQAMLKVKRGPDTVSSCTSDDEGRFTASVPTEGAVDLVFARFTSAQAREAATKHVGRLENVKASDEDLVLRLEPAPIIHPPGDGGHDAIAELRSWALGDRLTMSQRDTELSDIVKQITILSWFGDPSKTGIPILLGPHYAPPPGAIVKGHAGGRHEARHYVTHRVSFEFTQDDTSLYDILKFVADLVGGELRVEDGVLIGPRTSVEGQSSGTTVDAARRWVPMPEPAFQKKLRDVRIAQLVFEDAALPDVVSMVCAISREVDPLGQGVCLALEPSVIEALSPSRGNDVLREWASQTVTCNLRDVSVHDALAHIAEITGATLHVADVIVLARGSGAF